MVLISELSTKADVNIAKRPSLEEIARDSAMGRARFKRLYSMLYENGPGNGTFLTLPFDQLVEHGPGHEFKWERAAEPESVIELANSGEFSALVLSIGQAEKYQNLIKPDLPLIVKIDGHVYIGKELEKAHPRPVNISSVERARKAGADAIGIAWYPGEIETGKDIERIAVLTEESHNADLPVVLWGYSRGPVFDKIQSDNLLCCHYSVSLAESLGVDIVKVKFPAFVKKEKLEAYKSYLNELADKIPEAPESYLALEPKGNESEKEIDELHIKRSAIISSAADRTLVGYSGGPKAKNPIEELLKTTRYSLAGGIEGRIAGRNVWGSEMKEALELNRELIKFMRQPEYSRVLKELRFTKYE